MYKKGQSLLEYSILIMIILGVFVATQSYVKRGIQGRWKSSIDEFGDQYDPRTSNILLTTTLSTGSNSIVDIAQDLSGEKWTKRTDFSNTSETKISNTSVGPT